MRAPSEMNSSKEKFERAGAVDDPGLSALLNFAVCSRVLAILAGGRQSLLSQIAATPTPTGVSALATAGDVADDPAFFLYGPI